MSKTTQKTQRAERRARLLPYGAIPRGVLQDLRESGTWATAESLVQTLRLLHGLPFDEKDDRRLLTQVLNACRRLERDGCITAVQRYLMGEPVQGWQLAA